MNHIGLFFSRVPFLKHKSMVCLIRCGVSDKYLMSDILSTNLMLIGLLFLFSTFPLILGRKKVRFMI